MTDRFFTTQNCDRCKESLKGKTRTMSWFTSECLCSKCSNIEKKLKHELTLDGLDVAALEGCGYIPQLKAAVADIMSKYEKK